MTPVVRTAALWIAGLLGFGLLVSLLGDIGMRAAGGYGYEGGRMGFFAGALVFACLRLWLTERALRPRPPERKDKDTDG